MTLGAIVRLSLKRPKFLPQVIECYKTVTKPWTAFHVNNLVTGYSFILLTKTSFWFLVRSVWHPASIPCTLKEMWETTLALQESQKSSMELCLQMLPLMKVGNVLRDTSVYFWSSLTELLYMIANVLPLVRSPWNI